jgi:hypothetical protein
MIKETIFVLFLIGILGGGYYYYNLEDEINYVPEFQKNNFSENFEKRILDFSNIEEIHWNYMPLTYSFDSSCVGPIIPRIYWAFEIIENETNERVSFVEVKENSNIKFVCYKEKNEEILSEVESILTQGLTTFDYAGNVMNDTKIEFWKVSEKSRPSSCNKFPSLEIHEILHALGFAHIENNKYSIMYPLGGTECVERNDWITVNGKTFQPKDKIDDEIVSCLNYIYSNGKIGSCKDVPLYSPNFSCPEGAFNVEGTNYCYPKPNMIIKEGYCYEK